MLKLALLGTALATSDPTWYRKMRGLFTYQNENCSEYLSSEQDPCFRNCARGDLQITISSDITESGEILEWLDWKFGKTADSYVKGEQKPGSFCDCSKGGKWKVTSHAWELKFPDNEKLFHSIIRERTTDEMTIVYKLAASKDDKNATCSQLFRWEYLPPEVVTPTITATPTTKTKAYYLTYYRSYPADYKPPAYPHTAVPNAFDESNTAEVKPEFHGKKENGAEPLVFSGFALLAAMFAL
jgi:hypothetical protein